MLILVFIKCEFVEQEFSCLSFGLLNVSVEALY